MAISQSLLLPYSALNNYREQKMKELEPRNVVNLNTIIQLIMKKRFLITILLMLVLAVAAQAQEKKGFDWKKMTVGTEFVHNITGKMVSPSPILIYRYWLPLRYNPFDCL